MKLKYSHRNITITLTQTTCPNRITLHVGKKKGSVEVEGKAQYLKNQLQNSNKNYLNSASPFAHLKKMVRSAEVAALAQVFEKSATELKQKQKFLKCKNTILMVIFNVRTLIKIRQLSEVTATAQDHNIDIVCVQEHRYHHSEEDIKYHDTGKGLTFFPASARKKPVNAVIVTTFNGNYSTTIISCYTPTNASDETDLDTF